FPARRWVAAREGRTERTRTSDAPASGTHPTRTRQQCGDIVRNDSMNTEVVGVASFSSIMHQHRPTAYNSYRSIALLSEMVRADPRLNRTGTRLLRAERTRIVQNSPGWSSSSMWSARPGSWQFALAPGIGETGFGAWRRRWPD